jgi:predicted NBD/HSP70 family sugar kinase
MSRCTGAPGVKVASPASIREVNRSILLRLIRKHQPVSRAELARITGFFRSTVSSILDEFLAESLVTEEPRKTRSRGRSSLSLHLNNDSYRVLGLSIRPTECKLAYAGLSGHIQKTWSFATPSTPQQLVQHAGNAMAQAAREIGLRGAERFRRIGISVPGLVDARGKILWTPTHPELTDFPLSERIEADTGVAAVAENDADACALSELWLTDGDPISARPDFVVLNVGDFGAGCGVVIDGHIYFGHNGQFAGEFGHMVIEASSKEVCRCGRRGCWELFVTNQATWRRYRPRSSFRAERFEEMLTLAQMGDTAALQAVREMADHLALGLSNIGFAFNPAEIVISGRIARVWNLIRPALEHAHRAPQLRYRVRVARLGDDDLMLHGAVCLALREKFAIPRFGENGRPLEITA